MTGYSQIFEVSREYGVLLMMIFCIRYEVVSLHLDQMENSFVFALGEWKILFGFCHLILVLDG